MYVVRSFVISALPSRVCPTRRTHDWKMYTNDYYKRLFEQCYLLPWRGEWSISGSTSPIFLVARSLNNSRKFSVTHHRHGYGVHRICAFVATRVDANHHGAGGTMWWVHIRGGTDARWPFRWRLPQERSEVGSAARARSTQRTSTVISLFSSRAYCFSLANEQRIRHHCATFFFLTGGTNY